MCLNPLAGLIRERAIENLTVTGLIPPQTVTITTFAKASSQRQYLHFM